jgi:hypothetical protein
MGELEKLAMIADGLQQLVVESKTTVVFEIEKKTFQRLSKLLNINGSESDKSFNIDMSGVMYYFILDEVEP